MIVGDYIKTWHDTGTFGVELFYSRIVKINRVNVRVLTENGDLVKVSKEFAARSLCAPDDWHPDIAHKTPLLPPLTSTRYDDRQ